MPDLRDYLPAPPWEGPPIPRMLRKNGRPYGPDETAAPEVKEIWRKAVAEVRQKYPIGHRVLMAEAERAHMSQEEMQLLIAHEIYIERRRVLLDRWRKEYAVEEKEEE